MKLWKRLTAAVTACSMMLGVAAAQERVVPEEQVLAATSSETTTKGLNSSGFTGECCDCNASAEFTIVKESDWDDTLGTVVDKEYAVLNEIRIELLAYDVTVVSGDIPDYGLHGNGVIDIPEEVNGIPVLKMDSMEIECRSTGPQSRLTDATVNINLPNSLEEIGELSLSDGRDFYYDEKYDKVFVHYNGTCRDFLSRAGSIGTMPVVCTDGSFFCEQVTGGYRKTDTITYSGTMAQWREFCPSTIDVITNCSDGTLKGAFPVSDNFKFSADGTACFIGNLSSYTEKLAIPETEMGYTVTAIGDAACKGLSYLEYVSIPNTVTSIGDEAFLNCSNLRSITIPSSVTKIGKYAFGYKKGYNGGYQSTHIQVNYDGTMAQWQAICPSSLSELETVCSDGTLNKPLPTSSHYTFSKDGTACFVGKLSFDTETLVIPATEQGYTVTAIGAGACKELSALYSVSIPHTVKSVGDEAFLNCRNLLDIVVPSSVTSIGDYAFGYWQNSDGSYSKMSTVTIYCEEGSAAHQYVVSNGLNYVLQDDPIVTTTATSATTTTTTTRSTTSDFGFTVLQSTTATTNTYWITYPSTQTTTQQTTTQRETTTTQSTTYPTTQQTTTQPTTRSTTQPPASSTTRETTSWRETTTTNITTTTTTSSDKIILKVGETADISGRYADCTFASANMSIAAVSGNGVVMGLSIGETYIVVTFADGSLDVLAVTVTDGAATTTTDASETEKLCGDVTLDGKIDLTDAIILNKYCADVVKLSVPAYANADCTADGNVDTNDSIALLRFLVHIINALPSVE